MPKRLFSQSFRHFIQFAEQKNGFILTFFTKEKNSETVYKLR